MKTNVLTEADEQEIREQEIRERERERAANPQAYAAKEKRERDAEKAYKERRRQKKEKEDADFAYDQHIHTIAADHIKEGYRVWAKKTPDADMPAVREAHDWLMAIWEKNTPKRKGRRKEYTTPRLSLTS